MHGLDVDRMQVCVRHAFVALNESKPAESSPDLAASTARDLDTAGPPPGTGASTVRGSDATEASLSMVHD